MPAVSRHGVSTRVVVNGRRPGRDRGPGWLLLLVLSWLPDDPASVQAELIPTPRHPALPRGRWRVRPATLRAGLSAPVGNAGIRLKPDPDGSAVVMELEGGSRPASVQVPHWQLRAFLQAVEEAVGETVEQAGEPALEQAREAAVESGPHREAHSDRSVSPTGPLPGPR
jgi:hypothetical protein